MTRSRFFAPLAALGGILVAAPAGAVAVVETYNLELNPEIVFSSASGSDHASYWAYKFPAILAIEDLNDFNPHYHQTTDRLGKLDFAYFSNIVKASLATLAHMSCLVDGGWGTISGGSSCSWRGTNVSAKHSAR